MKNKVILAGLAALVVLIGFGIWMFGSQKAAAPESESNTKTTTQQTQTPSSPEAATPDPSNVTITYTDKGFDKPRYTVKKGSIVKLVNQSSSMMEFSSDNHPTHQLNPELNLQALPVGQDIAFTPTKVGSWGVHDHLNPGVTTTLVVIQ